jgi:hypothetical protein
MTADSGGTGRMLRPEHGEGDPCCQIQGSAEGFRNSELGHESGRTTPDYNYEMYFAYNAIKKITIGKGLCIFMRGCTAFSVAGNLTGVE